MTCSQDYLPRFHCFTALTLKNWKWTIDNPQTFVKTSFSQMLAHTIDCGLQRGYLDESCRPCADKMRNPVIGKVDKYGRVQGVCGAPNFNAPGTAAEGQAFFLLMEAAWALCPQIAGPSKKLSEQRLLQAPSGGSD